MSVRFEAQASRLWSGRASPRRGPRCGFTLLVGATAGCVSLLATSSVDIGAYQDVLFVLNDGGPARSGCERGYARAGRVRKRGVRGGALVAHWTSHLPSSPKQEESLQEREQMPDESRKAAGRDSPIATFTACSAPQRKPDRYPEGTGQGAQLRTIVEPYRPAWRSQRVRRSRTHPSRACGALSARCHGPGESYISKSKRPPGSGGNAASASVRLPGGLPWLSGLRRRRMRRPIASALPRT